MSHPILYCGDMGCGERLRCVLTGVWVNEGLAAVRAGDVYDCPTCGKEVVIGAERPVTLHDNEELVLRVKSALDTAGTPYVRHQYVVENH